jgi:glutamine cyclotransferase
MRSAFLRAEIVSQSLTRKVFGKGISGKDEKIYTLAYARVSAFGVLPPVVIQNNFYKYIYFQD